MIPDGRTLILVADGGRARLFEEARRGGPLTEHPDWLAGLSVPPMASPGPRGGTHDSLGHGSHATARPGGRDKAEAGFLTQLARRVETIFNQRRFDHLILIAAPRSLGHLRRHLPAGLTAKLELSEPHDRVAATVAEIQLAVRALRRVNA